MGKDEREIKELLQTIVLGRQRYIRFPVMMGMVVAGSVDEVLGICSVILSSDDDSSPTEGVLLNAITSNINGVLEYPADNSYVWVAELDGQGKYGVIKCCDVYKVVVNLGNSVFKITDGIVNTKIAGNTELELNNTGVKINANGKNLGTVLQNLISHIELLTVPTGTGPSGVPVNVADFISDGVDLGMLLV